MQTHSARGADGDHTRGSPATNRSQQAPVVADGRFNPSGILPDAVAVVGDPHIPSLAPLFTPRVLYAPSFKRVVPARDHDGVVGRVGVVLVEDAALVGLKL